MVPDILLRWQEPKASPVREWRKQGHRATGEKISSISYLTSLSLSFLERCVRCSCVGGAGAWMEWPSDCHPFVHILESVWGSELAQKSLFEVAAIIWNYSTSSPSGWLLSKKQKVKSVDEAPGSLVHCWWECKMVQMLWRAVWEGPSGSSHYPAIQFWTHTHKNLKQGYEQILEHSIHSSIIHSEKVETTQMPIHKWMDKQDVVYPYNGVLCSLTMGWSSGTCYSMDEPRSEINQTQKNKYCMIHLFEVLKSHQIQCLCLPMQAVWELRSHMLQDQETKM